MEIHLFRDIIFIYFNNFIILFLMIVSFLLKLLLFHVSNYLNKSVQ